MGGAAELALDGGLAGAGAGAGAIEILVCGLSCGFASGRLKLLTAAKKALLAIGARYQN